MSALASYPISSSAARQLERPLFGHVIDGEVVPSLDGATMDVIDPATGAPIARAAAGSAADVDRAARSAARRLRRRPLARPRAAREGAPDAPHGRRSSPSTADVFAEIDVLDAGLLRSYTGFIVEFAVNGIDYFAGWPSKLERRRSRPCPPSSPCTQSASRSASSA